MATVVIISLKLHTNNGKMVDFIPLKKLPKWGIWQMAFFWSVAKSAIYKNLLQFFTAYNNMFEELLSCQKAILVNILTVKKRKK